MTVFLFKLFRQIIPCYVSKSERVMVDEALSLLHTGTRCTLRSTLVPVLAGTLRPLKNMNRRCQSETIATGIQGSASEVRSSDFPNERPFDALRCWRIFFGLSLKKMNQNFLAEDFPRPATSEK